MAPQVFSDAQRPLEVVTIAPPPPEQRRARAAGWASGPRTRYDLPERLDSASPVGYRTRSSFTLEEAAAALGLLSLAPATGFAATPPPRERELFEETSLGILSARQSTNFRGHRQFTVGPADVERVVELLAGCAELEAPIARGPSYAHLVFSRPYRTPFTALLTFVGHRPLTSLATVPARALRKTLGGAADIPTIAWLPHLHAGILADTLERAVLIASRGERVAQVFMRPFVGSAAAKNRRQIQGLTQLCGLGPGERAAGWELALVALVGGCPAERRLELSHELWRKLGANLLAFRSERVQPGVNADARAPAQYQARQDMDVSEEFTVQAGRAAYNAFARWSGLERDECKALLMLDRIDVLTDAGKARLREIRAELDQVTDHVIAGLPKWIDLPTGRMLSRNAERGRKAFALAGQRIYAAGLSIREVEQAGLDWPHAVRCVGAMASRSTLYAELMGATAIPEGCDLLAGCCMMAGPVNQNDVGKTFFGMPDLLAARYGAREPSSLLVWTLKAKTVADPIGNEQQLLDAGQKGALVDLRPGPHEVVAIRSGGRWLPQRQRDGRINRERAFADVGNFVVGPDGREIDGNRGEPWPTRWADAPVW